LFRDTPEAEEFMRFLATPEAQRIWPDYVHGTAFSVNRNVDPSVYGNSVSKRIAQSLTTGTQLCFDASDLMPATMTAAFYQAVLEYVSDPSRLPSLLDQLEAVRESVPSTEWLDIPCGQRH
jgi:alpha-glucoside transport system substrate-binding protein